MLCISRMLVILFALFGVLHVQCQTINAQMPLGTSAVGHTLAETRVSRSRPRKKLLSRTCDPLMTVAEEAELISRLGRECPLQWGTEISIRQFAVEIGELIPVRLDLVSMEEIGLDVDRPMLFDFTRRPSEKSTDDAMKSRWWRSSVPDRSFGSRSLLSTLIRMLTPLDCTFQIQGGVVVITTIDGADEMPVTRMYDVAPLVPLSSVMVGSNLIQGQNQQQYRDFDSLLQLIETSVNPDTWEALGGNSTLTIYSVNGHDWMIVSTTTMTHLKIQSLLHRLNQ